MIGTDLIEMKGEEEFVWWSTILLPLAILGHQLDNTLLVEIINKR
jgi:hypothetical protein